MDGFDSVQWPITTSHRILDTRNTYVEMAKETECTHLLFLDPDMEPDVEVGHDAQALPFFDTSWRFIQQVANGQVERLPSGSLAVVGAPATSGPPDFKINVFPSDDDGNIYQHSPLDVIEKKGHFERVAAVGTALMLIPMEAFDLIEPPYFDDLYTDQKKCGVSQSQDVYFCLKCADKGISIWCNWYSWARHYKTIGLDRPTRAVMEYMETSSRTRKILGDTVNENRDCSIDKPCVPQIFGSEVAV